MSQRGLAPHADSRRSSGSPTKDEEGSPRQHGSLSGGSETHGGAAGVASTKGPGRIQHLPPKALGVHNILNPSEPRLMASEAPGAFHPRQRETEAMLGAHAARMYTGARSFFPAQAGLVSHPGTPVGNLTPLRRPSSSGRDSPAVPYPFPAGSAPRKASSPKLPRAPGPSQAAPPHLEGDPRAQALASAPSPVKRPYETEASEERRPLAGHHHPPGRALGAVALQARSTAPPGARPSDAPYVPSTTVTPHGRPHSLHAPPQFQHAAAPSRSLSAMAASGDGPSAWSEVIRRSGVGGGMGSAEGQQAFMTLPGSDTPIPVQVDYSQASKKADEKRQRNAKASTRHRRKKKTMQEENMRQLQELKDERQQMAEELEDLKQQRDFYRDERNRLREIVARTPGIHQHAAGPASPPGRSPGSHAERSPGQHGQMSTPSQGYASDPSSAERPMQRRRTDDRPDFSASGFGAPVGGPPPPPPPSTLTPMAGASSAYGAPQRPPSTASSGGVERLPPLRAIEGAPASLGPGQAQEQDPRTGQWRPAQPRPYETGWATAPRKPYEGHAPQWQ